MNLLFSNITAVTQQANKPVLHNVDVGIDGDKIAFIEPHDATRTHLHPTTRVIDGTHKILMPGMYNGHAHAAMTLFRGYANDRALEDWLFNYIFPAERRLTPELVHTGTLLAIAEMISSGVICFTDMYFHMDKVAQAAHEAGVLANVSNAVIGFDRDSYDFHKDNVYAQTLRTLEQFHNKNDGRIKAEASIHGVYTSHPPAWRQVMDFAHQHELGLHVHLSETKTEHDGCIEKNGVTPAKMFADHGVFDRPTTAAHGVWLTDADIALLAEKNVSVSHNPLSNLKLASGLAPVCKMLARGINVTLGTDGMASNNSHDLFEEMKMASLLQKYHNNDPLALPATQALQMATSNGAKAAGRAHESGQITPGYHADLVVIDLNNPRQTVSYDPILSLAYATSGRDVEMTLCRGKILYEKGEYKTIDIERVLHDARAAKEVFLA
ncbi:MAG: amidohydrolase [Defluviitaleaceae bacterium]|nr:amidohydrolase [Defluviitaleaceae bacterium]